jgi:hypothetical protein
VTRRLKLLGCPAEKDLEEEVGRDSYEGFVVSVDSMENPFIAGESFPGLRVFEKQMSQSLLVFRVCGQRVDNEVSVILCEPQSAAWHFLDLLPRWLMSGGANVIVIVQLSTGWAL